MKTTLTILCAIFCGCNSPLISTTATLYKPIIINQYKTTIEIKLTGNTKQDPNWIKLEPNQKLFQFRKGVILTSLKIKTPNGIIKTYTKKELNPITAQTGKQPTTVLLSENKIQIIQ